MRTASAISTGLHAAVLLFAVVSFSGKSLEATPVESLPVDLISSKEFSQITKGQQDAKPAEKPKPLVEKIAPETKPVEESKPKVVDNKPEVKATQQKSAPPPPEPEQKEVEKKESKPEPKPPAPVATDKTDPIADKLKQAKDEPKPLPPKKPPQKQEPKFDVNKIAALIDQREPQRTAAAGNELNKEPSLGRANGMAPQLSQNELAAFRERLKDCWTVPVGAENMDKLQVVFRILFNQNGTVRGMPQLVEASASTLGPALAESAKRAILQCQPYTMLRRESYDQWKDIEVAFNPKDMFR